MNKTQKSSPPISDLDLLDDTYPMKEWLAWRVVCKQLSQRGIDVNSPDNDTLIRAIRHYAATYHQLYAKNCYHSQHESDRQAVEPLIQELR